MQNSVPSSAGGCTFTKKLFLVLFTVQAVLLLAYFNLGDYFSHIAAVPTEEPASKTVISPLGLSKEPDFRHLVELDYSTDIEIKFPESPKDDNSSANSTQGGAVKPISVAIGLGLTTRSKGKQLNTIGEHIFFTTLLPSFCKTATVGYAYSFYIAFDYNDPLLHKREQLEEFSNSFSAMRRGSCKDLTYVGLNFVNCSHTKKPAWAQNDAMMSAYMDDNDYYYRINDDTTMDTAGWTPVFIKKLAEYNPPNIGVVGPMHSGGNMAILTYDFVHRSHVDAFGFYYPRDFLDWHADRWITDVYRPGRITKLKDIKLKHTMSKGTRYVVHHFSKQRVRGLIEVEKKKLIRFIHAKETDLGHDKSRVIAMSLVGDKAKETFGVVRNIMLQPIHFPTWTVRIYLEQNPNSTTGHGRHIFPPVSSNVVNKLKSLPVQLVHVNTDNVQLHHTLWPMLSLEDESVDYLLVRKPSSRLRDRDAAVVGDWMKSEEAFHVIKDHPKHSTYDVIPGLWGANTVKLRQILGGEITSLLKQSEEEADFLNTVLWPKLANHTVCHDSVLCTSGCRPFPVVRNSHEYLGQEFGPCGEFITEKVKDASQC